MKLLYILVLLTIFSTASDIESEIEVAVSSSQQDECACDYEWKIKEGGESPCAGITQRGCIDPKCATEEGMRFCPVPNAENCEATSKYPIDNGLMICDDNSPIFTDDEDDKAESSTSMIGKETEVGFRPHCRFITMYKDACYTISGKLYCIKMPIVYHTCSRWANPRDECRTDADCHGHKNHCAQWQHKVCMHKRIPQVEGPYSSGGTYMDDTEIETANDVEVNVGKVLTFKSQMANITDRNSKFYRVYFIAVIIMFVLITIFIAGIHFHRKRKEDSSYAALLDSEEI